MCHTEQGDENDEHALRVGHGNNVACHPTPPVLPLGAHEAALGARVGARARAWWRVAVEERAEVVGRGPLTIPGRTGGVGDVRGIMEYEGYHEKRSIMIARSNPTYTNAHAHARSNVPSPLRIPCTPTGWRCKGPACGPIGKERAYRLHRNQRRKSPP